MDIPGIGKSPGLTLKYTSRPVADTELISTCARSNQIGALTIHWQGGEAMLLPPDWYQQAFDLIQCAAAAHGKRVDHGLQTNMLGYGPK